MIEVQILFLIWIVTCISIPLIGILHSYINKDKVALEDFILLTFVGALPIIGQFLLIFIIKEILASVYTTSIMQKSLFDFRER